MKQPIIKVIAQSGLIFLVEQKVNLIADKHNILFGNSLRLNRIKSLNPDVLTDGDNSFYFVTDIQVIKRDKISQIESATSDEIKLFNFMRDFPDKEVPITKRRFGHLVLPKEVYQYITFD